jgi:hypothetical protein
MRESKPTDWMIGCSRQGMPTYSWPGTKARLIVHNSEPPSTDQT